MNSLAFPNIFNNTSTNVIEDHKATVNNLKLLLASSKGSLFGDPYFGTLIKKLTFEQNNKILQDIVIDEIYTVILQFVPQLLLDRKNIKITSDGINLYANIRAQNILDYETDMYNINLISYEVE